MKTEAELREALALLSWYIDSPRFQRQLNDTRMNIIGVHIGLEWLIGSEDNPVHRTLKDIKQMQRIDNAKAN